MQSVVTISENNLGPLVNIVVWILMVIMCLATILKLFSKWFITRSFALDDLFVSLAMVCTPYVADISQALF